MVVDARKEVKVTFRIVVLILVQLKAAIPTRLVQVRVEPKAMDEGMESNR